MNEAEAGEEYADIEQHLNLTDSTHRKRASTFLRPDNLKFQDVNVTAILANNSGAITRKILRDAKFYRIMHYMYSLFSWYNTINEIMLIYDLSNSPDSRIQFVFKLVLAGFIADHVNALFFSV
jgi:hypothetical protein